MGQPLATSRNRLRRGSFFFFASANDIFTNTISTVTKDLIVEAHHNDIAASGRSKRNWWKIAFFVTLIAFELAREIAVLASARGARPNTTFMVSDLGNGFIKAQGQWRRSDGGSKLVPTTVTIECRQHLGQCIEATTNIIDDSVFSPDVDFFDAKFTPDAVTYENDFPTCATYNVRIDLKLKQVFAVRERKSTDGTCANLEPRLQSQLAGNDYDQDQLEGHFVPLVRLIGAFF